MFCIAVWHKFKCTYSSSTRSRKSRNTYVVRTNSPSRTRRLFSLNFFSPCCSVKMFSIPFIFLCFSLIPLKTQLHHIAFQWRVIIFQEKATVTGTYDNDHDLVIMIVRVSAPNASICCRVGVTKEGSCHCHLPLGTTVWTYEAPRVAGRWTMGSFITDHRTQGL